MENNSFSLSSYTTKYTIEYLIEFFNFTLNLNLTLKNPIQYSKAILTYSKENSNPETYNIIKAIFCGLLGIDITERLLNSHNSQDNHIKLNLSNKTTEIKLLHNYLLILCIDCYKCLLKKSLKTPGLNIEEQLSIMIREKIVFESEKEKEKHKYGYMYYLNSLFYLLNANFFFIIVFLNENNDSYFLNFIQSFIKLSSSLSSYSFLKYLNVPKSLNELKELGFNVMALINYDKIELNQEIAEVIKSTSFNQSIKTELISKKQKEIRHEEKEEEDAVQEIIEEEINEDITRPFIASSGKNIETTNEETGNIVIDDENTIDDNNSINNEEYYKSQMMNDVYFDFYDKLNEELKKQKDELNSKIDELNTQHNREIRKLEEKFNKEIYTLNEKIAKLTEKLNGSS